MQITVLVPVEGDNAHHIRAAIDQSGGDPIAQVRLGPGIYQIHSPLFLDRPVRFSGSGEGVTILSTGPDGRIVVDGSGFEFQSQRGTTTTLEHFTIQATTLSSGETPAAIELKRGAKLSVRNVQIIDSHLGLHLNQTNAAMLRDISIDTGRQGSPAAGILVQGGTDHRLQDITLSRPSQSAGEQGVGLDLQDCRSIRVSNVSIEHFQSGVRLHPGSAAGLEGQKLVDCLLERVDVRGCSQAGFALDVGYHGGGESRSKILGVRLGGCSAVGNHQGVAISKADTRAQLDGIDLNDMTITDNRAHGVFIAPSYSENTSDNRISNIKVENCNIAGNSCAPLAHNSGVYIGDGTTAVSVTHCTIGFWGGREATQRHGIEIAPSPIPGTAGLLITGNTLTGNVGALLKDQSQTHAKVIRHNLGFVTEFIGQTYIPHGQTEIVVNHFCSAKPTFIAVTPLDNMYNYGPIQVVEINQTTFKIVLTSAAYSNKFLQFSAQV